LRVASETVWNELKQKYKEFTIGVTDKIRRKLSPREQLGTSFLY